MRVVALPANVDPDEFLQKEGSNAFEDLLSKSLPLPLYHLEIREEFLKDLNVRKKVIEELLEGFSRIPLPDLAPFRSQIAAALEIPRYALEAMLLDFKANMKRGTEKKGKRGDFSVYINRQKQQKQKKHVTDAQEAALFSLCGMILQRDGV